MWLTTTHGYCSAVADGEIPGNFLLRFRTEKHAKAFSKLLGHGKRPEIRETPLADYRWKFSVTKQRFTTLLITLGDTVDYTNFKGACHHTPEMSGAAETSALFACWGAWHRVQRTEQDAEERAEALARTPLLPFDFYDETGIDARLTKHRRGMSGR